MLVSSPRSKAFSQSKGGVAWMAAATISFVLAGVLVGCGASLPSEPARSADLSEVSQEPFALDVLDELNDGEQLAVVVRVVAASRAGEVPASLRLRTLRDGAVIGEQVTDLLSLLPASEADRRDEREREGTFMMTAPSRGASDYQLELSWGAGRAPSEVVAEVPRAVLPKNTHDTEGASRKVALRNVEVSSFSPNCQEGSPCGVSFTVRGTLENRADAGIIHRVTLGVGYLDRSASVSLDKGSPIPHNEQFVTLENVNLAPGASRPLEFALSETLSREEATRLFPSLRIVRAE